MYLFETCVKEEVGVVVPVVVCRRFLHFEFGEGAKGASTCEVEFEVQFFERFEYVGELLKAEYFAEDDGDEAGDEVGLDEAELEVQGIAPAGLPALVVDDVPDGRGVVVGGHLQNNLVVLFVRLGPQWLEARLHFLDSVTEFGGFDKQEHSIATFAHFKGILSIGGCDEIFAKFFHALNNAVHILLNLEFEGKASMGKFDVVGLRELLADGLLLCRGDMYLRGEEIDGEGEVEGSGGGLLLPEVDPDGRVVRMRGLHNISFNISERGEFIISDSTTVITKSLQRIRL
jgi:hypothetical protein